ncbi:unnamed protein product [[Actinomadura] parvosata subsp. kistnae]|nr:unnamed protein product [Actinomadura parvosata subsp. kistnae]
MSHSPAAAPTSTRCPARPRRRRPPSATPSGPPAAEPPPR